VYHPTTYPGSILPHAWLEGEGTRVSTHDLTGSGIRFVLITGPGGTAWREAAAEVAEKFSVEIVTSFVGEGADWVNPDGRWRRVRAIDDTGAVLVRPDNHIAWRSTAAVDKPTDVLTGVMQQILRR
jgi:2,4-dichlorophenol 6-monooxygenase